MSRTRARLRGVLVRAADVMPARERREFASFLRETEERHQDLIVGDERQPMLFDGPEIARKMPVRQ
jgi:hypothetical protein